MSAFSVRAHMRGKTQSNGNPQCTDRGSILVLCAALILAAAMVLIVILGTGQTDWTTESSTNTAQVNADCC